MARAELVLGPVVPGGAVAARPATGRRRPPAAGRPRLRRKLVVVGQGHVGLPIAVRAAGRGFEVVGLDSDEEKVLTLANGQSDVDDVAHRDLCRMIELGRYVASVDPADCDDFDVAVIAVPTPLADGLPDLRAVIAATESLAQYVRPGCTVILESTTYPGTTEDVLRPRLEAGSRLVAGRDFHLGYSPERIDPGNRDYPFWEIPKVVSGIDDGSLEAVDAFYSAIVRRTVRVRSTRVAELTKLLENTFRHVNTALVNELAIVARDLGIDIREVIDAASTKPFGFMRLDPGPGVGGHCLPIDPSYLSWKVERTLGRRFRFVDLANDVNRHMPDYVVERVIAALNRRRRSVNGSRLLLLGLAYKRNSSDGRESPAREVARKLVALGAEVRAHDDHVGPSEFDAGVQRAPLSSDELAQADLVVILTDHDDVPYGLVADSTVDVLDTRNRLRAPRVEQL